jgi:bifunctional ADP-heptose synthase (sugar kinase/adenylyltransferase)
VRLLWEQEVAGSNPAIPTIFKMKNILLIGESCTDIYFFGSVNRISPEAPVPVFNFLKQKSFLGMSQNVYRNLKIFPFKVHSITNNPSFILKERYIDEKSKQQLIRVDKGLSVDPITLTNKEKKLIKNSDLIIISDYDKGYITHELAEYICKTSKVPVFVDSKKNDLSCFNNAFIKINDLEFSKNPKFPDNYNLILTSGAKGSKFDDKIFPAPKVEVFDVSGAGDVFLSVLSGCYALSSDINQSIELATNIASKSVAYFGNYSISKKDIKCIF